MGISLKQTGHDSICVVLFVCGTAAIRIRILKYRFYENEAMGKAKVGSVNACMKIQIFTFLPFSQ
jgi:hypothetical protein